MMIKTTQITGDKRMLLTNILHRKANGTEHILRRNCLLHDATKQIAVGRRTQFLDHLRNRYWELKEEAEDLKRGGGGNDSISGECKEEIKVIFQKSMKQVKGNVLNNNNNNNIIL